MKQDYKVILKLLYDSFGDEIVDYSKTKIEEKLRAGRPKDKNLSSDNDTKRKQIVASSDITDKSSTSDDEAAFNVEKDSSDSLSYEVVEKPNYYNADKFEEQTLIRLQHDAVEILSSGDVVGAVKELVLMAGEVRKFEEAQITVRTDIAARRDIAIANIETQKAALLAYLDKSFDERKEDFQALFSVVDDALKKDNMQQLAMGLESVIKLAESSPFKDLRTVEETATALMDPDHEWDF